MKKFIIILSLFFTSFTYAQITTIKVQGSGGSGSVGTLQQVFNTESGGSVLTKLDTINWSTTGIRVLGAGALTLNTGSIFALAGLISATNSGSTAIAGSSTSSTGVQGSSTNLFGVNAVSTNSYALHAITSSTTTTVAAANFERSTAVTNTVLPLIQIQRSTSGTAANGIGTSLEFITEVSDGQNLTSNTLVSKWTDATVGTRTSQFDLTGINSTAVETFANFQTGGVVRVNNLADTLATKAYARSVGGSGGGNTIYTGDDDLTGDRVVTLSGNSLAFNDDATGNNLLSIEPNPANQQVNIGVYNTDAGGSNSTSGVNVSNTSATFGVQSSFDNETKVASINGLADATTSTITHTADSIAFNSTLSGTSNGYVWTLANSALGTGYWAAASGGITTLNTLTGATQTFATGTTGTDFGISSSGTTHTFNLPTSSATNRGLLSSTDWSTFNNKLSTATAASTYLPLAGGTMVGNILATDNTYDLGASGATRFRTAYLGTSAVTPLVIGGSGTTQALTLQSSSGSATTGSDIIFKDNNTEFMRILNNGNVGIGTASPNIAGNTGTVLTISTPTASAVGALEFQGNQTVNGNGVGLFAAYNTSNLIGVFQFIRDGGANNTGSMNIFTSNAGVLTEKVRFQYNGNVGIGITAPTAVLHIKAGTATANTAPIQLPAGVFETTPRSGLMETDATNDLAWTNSSAVRKYVTTSSNKILLAGTDATTMTFPTTSATIARTDAAQSFAGTQTFNGLIQAAVGLTTSTTTLNSNFYATSGATLTGSQSSSAYLINGNNAQWRVSMRGATATVATAANDVWALLIGNNTFTEATSGTSALSGGLAIVTQTFTGGSGATTDFQNVYIGDAPIGGVNNWALNTGATQIRGNLTLGTAGNKINITEGSNGSVGQTVLVSGTKAITITGLTTSGRAFVTLVSPSGVTLTTTYQAVCTTNTLTIQANIAAGTINTADGSTLNYFIIN